MYNKSLGFAIPLTFAYATYRIVSLNQQYPLSPSAKYNQAPSVIPTLTPKHDQADYIYARIPLSRPIPQPLETFTRAFYSTWTLRLEAWITGVTGIAPTHLDRNGQSFCNGLFPIHERFNETIIVRWATPRSVLDFLRRIGRPTVGGGVQELSAVVTENGKQLEIGYACAQWMDGPEENRLGDLGMALHRFYMRFLLDSAKKRLQRELR